MRTAFTFTLLCLISLSEAQAAVDLSQDVVSRSQRVLRLAKDNGWSHLNGQSLESIAKKTNAVTVAMAEGSDDIAFVSRMESGVPLGIRSSAEFKPNRVLLKSEWRHYSELEKDIVSFHEVVGAIGVADSNYNATLQALWMMNHPVNPRSRNKGLTPLVLERGAQEFARASDSAGGSGIVDGGGDRFGILAKLLLLEKLNTMFGEGKRFYILATKKRNLAVKISELQRFVVDCRMEVINTRIGESILGNLPASIVGLEVNNPLVPSVTIEPEVQVPALNPGDPHSDLLVQFYWNGIGSPPLEEYGEKLLRGFAIAGSVSPKHCRP